MRQSHLFQKTLKQLSADESSKNAQILLKGGYIQQVMAGVYSYLPLGLKVIAKIEKIIREEMDAVGGQEILMPALHPRDLWDATGRWDTVDVLFKLKGHGDRDLALGPTHEEVVTPLAAQLLSSYKDYPAAVYQIQTKFRNEARAKSGVLRTREFRMKDMYSFHLSQDDLDSFYQDMIQAYMRVYKRCGLGDKTKLTYASGGLFSQYSHEFQTINEAGEDTIFMIPGTTYAINKEIIHDQEALASLIPNYTPGDEKQFAEIKAIEVGNIFMLGTKFTQAFNMEYAAADGSRATPIMGCYGIGSSRLMGTIAECLGTEKGLIWPKELAPYEVHFISLLHDEAEHAISEQFYLRLKAAGVDVLYDNRLDVRAGAKFADADLIGIPKRVILSKKTLEEGCVEVTSLEAGTNLTQMIPMETFLQQMSKNYF